MPPANNNITVLLGEDDLEVRSYLETALRCQGYSVEIAEDGVEVLAAFQRGTVPISAVILDAILPRKDGIEALQDIRRFDTVTPIIVIDGAASKLEVGQAMKSGANDFLVKPVSPEDLRHALTAALTNRGSAAAPGQTVALSESRVLFGSSPQMRNVERLIGPIACSDAPVLILGETGVGKEVLAREIHGRSPRAKKPILKVNCAALPSELVESELFGYERGAFTGAFQKKPGLFEFANGAAILLDEIGDMDVRLQAKLLQVLQDQEFQRLGGKDTIRVDVRIIAATHRDLKKAIADKVFREDLYYRLNVLSIEIPPLRERREDVIPLAEFLIQKHTDSGAAPLPIPPALVEVFLNYHWPGNVRELENVIRKFLVFRDAKAMAQELKGQLRSEAVVVPIRPVAPSAPAPPPVRAQPIPVVPELKTVPGPVPILEQLERAKREAERNAILAVLRSTNWNRREAARQLHIDYKALLYKMKVLSIKKEKPSPAQRHAATVSSPALTCGASDGAVERCSVPVVIGQTE